MTSLIIKTRTETVYMLFTRPEFADDALKVFSCDNSDFKWRVNYPDDSDLQSPRLGYQP
jgi:hypothetical protein